MAPDASTTGHFAGKRQSQLRASEETTGRMLYFEVQCATIDSGSPAPPASSTPHPIFDTAQERDPPEPKSAASDRVSLDHWTVMVTGELCCPATDSLTVALPDGSPLGTIAFTW